MRQYANRAETLNKRINVKGNDERENFPMKGINYVDVDRSLLKGINSEKSDFRKAYEYVLKEDGKRLMGRYESSNDADGNPVRPTRKNKRLSEIEANRNR